jgi:hypothetical protein
MASRRLNSDRFFTADYTPAVYTQAGMNWINNNSMATVLLRHYPQLRPAIGALSNAFAPWDRAVPGSTRPAGATGRVRASDPASLIGATMSQLGELFRSARVGPIPNGHGRGTVLLGTGGLPARLAAAVSHALLWRGKVVNARKGRLKNLISALPSRRSPPPSTSRTAGTTGNRASCSTTRRPRSSPTGPRRDPEIAPASISAWSSWAWLPCPDFTLDFNREQ